MVRCYKYLPTSVPPSRHSPPYTPPMVRSYRFDVRGLFLGGRTAGAKGNVSEDGPSQLSIVLHPAVPFVQQQAASYPYPLPSNTVGVHSHGIRHHSTFLGPSYGP